jgi:GT2 family glycosyltransferase
MTPDPPATATPSESGLSIVIPSWNGRVLLERYLPTVLASAAAFESACSPPTEVIVADDASTDGTREWLASGHPQVRCESAAERAGFAPTANRGVRAARYPLVYLVNNDVAMESATLPPLVAHFRPGEMSARSGSAAAFAVASQVYDLDTGRLSGAGQLGDFRRGFIGIHRRYFVAGECAEDARPWLTLFATGGSSMFDRAKFLELGGFDESFAPFGWEDVELSLRAWKTGLEVHYEPCSAVWHQFSSTIKPVYSRRYVRTVYERNRLLAHWYHLDTASEKTSHVAFLVLKLFGAVFNGRWELWVATTRALRRRNDVRDRRQFFTTHGRLRLAQVLRRVAAELDRPGARLLGDGSPPMRLWSRTTQA